LRALEAGKHVLCEKPIALNANEARALVAARAREGKHVAEAFMVRFHPQWRRVQELVGSGAIGRPRAIHSFFSYHLLLSSARPDQYPQQAARRRGAL
jgi:predicted dehydrogenase